MSTPVSFSHGVASGDPYPDSVIIWTRVTPPAGFDGLLDVQWEVATSADFATGSIKSSGTFSTSAARDWTVKVDATGLSADTPYYYRFRSGNTVSAVGQTKTLQLNSDPVRLAVFSCTNFPAAQQFDAYARAAAIHSANPYDAWLHLGDYIYEYGAGGYGAAEDAAGSRGFLPDREILSLDDYRQRYAQYHTDINLQNLRAVAPLIAGWDDHETANNSWSGGAQNHQSETEGDWIARRDAALKAYYEWLPIREPGQRQASDDATALSPLTQAYRSFNFGDVLSLHMLETRVSARDEQLAYPDAAAVQARIGAILTDSALVAAYAAQLGLTAPTDPGAIPAFAAALAPAVTQELVLATVQQAWGDPSRDLIGDKQLAWLQKQMAGSNAAWQVLGQQVLMQSMAVPAELLLNAGDPSLLDKYAAPLQKLATDTAFAELSAAEQALFSEAGKIPYNLDAWDGYGVERETILQTALAQGKRLISLAGDTHNAWAGVLDTMAPGTKPAGTVAGVEFATPGVTSPGLEKYLPGADAYIRAKYPAVDGLDGLFSGYVNGLKYADLKRRGFLDLTVSKEEAIGSYQFLDGLNSFSGPPQWASETVVAGSDLSLSITPEATSQINWQPGWSELDLVFGLATDRAGGQTLLNPAAFATLPRASVQLADVTVLGSEAGERIFAGVGSLVDGAGGDDELFNTDSQGDNRLVGGIGTDQLFLRPINDRIIGGQLFSGAATFGLSPFTALVDQERDSFLIDSSNPGSTGSLQILDYEPGIDELLIDGVAPTGDWAAVRQQLQGLNVAINAAPQLSGTPVVISLKSGVEVSKDLTPFGSDLDGDSLQLLKLEGPSWISASGTVLTASVPVGVTENQLANTTLLLGFSDGKAVSSFTAQLTLNAAPTALALTNTVSSIAENTSTSSRIKVADIAITDDALGTNTITLSGADAASFEVVGTELFLKAGTALDFESKNSYALTLSASDSSLPGSTPVAAAFSLALSDVNEPPTALVLTNTVSSIAENTSTSSRIKVADIAITDDALGTNTITLSGADAASFEVIGTELFLKAGTVLDFESKTAYAVTVFASDSSLPGSTPVSAPFTMAVSDVNAPLVTISAIGGAGSIVSSQAGDNRVVGTAEASRSVSIFSGTTLLGSTTADGSGAFSYALSAADITTIGQGSNKTITARQTDLAGNTGSSQPFSFAVDTIAPLTTAAITAVSDNVGIITGTVAAGARTNDTTPTITGTISAGLASGETLRIYNGGTLLGSATVNNKTWTYTPTLPASAGTTYNITSRVADAAGNLGTDSAVRSFTLDTTAPLTTAVISSVSDNVGLIKGVVRTGGRTDDRTPTIKGTISKALATGETLRIYNGGTLLGSATVNNKTWTYTPTLPASAGTTYNITSRVADAAGNLGTDSAVRSFTLDTTAPLITAGPTATGASGISITSNENGTAALYKSDGSSLFLKSIKANTPVILTLAAQSSLATATLQIRDAAGNSTTAQPTFILGSNLADSLTGNSTANFLYGFSGKDTLDGGGGNDTLTGGLGRDTFRFSSKPNSKNNRDRITDFNVVEDRIQLENAVFTALPTTGTLAARAFISGSSFTTTAQRIRYESTTGNLFYDPDGNGTAASVNFAILSTGLAMTNSQFNVT